MIASKKNVSETAARWYIRMRDAAPDAPERSRFEVWLMESHTHQAEYTSIAETMQQLGHQKGLASLAASMQANAYLQKSAQKQKISKTLSSLAVIALIVVASLFSVEQYQTWQKMPVMQMATSNGVGKISTQVLQDGSKVTLCAQSQMQVTFYRNRRHVQLNRGEAIFEVAKDVARPFVVETDTAKITVLGTRFAVNKLSRLVRVSVDHGRVQVESPTGKLILNDGQVAEILPTLAPKNVLRNAQDAFTFVQGKLIFSGADIQEVADTINRYRKTPVVVNGQSARNISAVINTRSAEQFLQGLPNIAPVKIIDQPQQTIVQMKK